MSSLIAITPHTQLPGKQKKLVALNPNDQQERLKLADLYAQQDTDDGYEHAIEHYTIIVQSGRAQADTISRMAYAYVAIGKSHEALDLYDLLLKNYPTNPDLCVSIGKAYERMNEITVARDWYQRAISYDPNHVHAHISLAGAHWALGNLKDGFQEYEWRWHTVSQPIPNRWDGTEATGKTIVLMGESGLGDIIQFVRCAKMVKDRGANVILVVPKPLVQLFSLLPYVDGVVPPKTVLGSDHFATPIQIIPALFHLDEHSLPKDPYIFADPHLEKEWRKKLSSDSHFKIALCWQAAGFFGHVPQGRRSIPLAQFAPLASLKNVSLYSIQKGDGEPQIKNAPFKLITFDDFDDSHGAFMDTAAIMKAVDLVVTVDTSIAHLAGAMGVPTITLLPYHPDPRWQYNRSDTPWYPSMMLIRQKTPGSWDEPITQLIAEIEKRVANELGQQKMIGHGEQQ